MNQPLLSKTVESDPSTSAHVEDRWMRAAIFGSMLLFAALVMLLILAPTLWNRIAIDDFCYGGQKREQGLLGMQRHWYMTWSGRTFATAIITSVSVLVRKSGSLAAYSITTVACLVATSALLLRRSLQIPRWVAGCLGCFAVTLLFLMTPDPGESWYWLAGSASYLWPITMITLTGSLVVGPAVVLPRWLHAGITALAAFFGAAGNETLGFLFVLSCGVALLLQWLTNTSGSLARRLASFSTTLRTRTAIALVASGVSFLIMAAAPGNAARQALMTPVSTFEALSIAAGAVQIYLDVARAHDTLLLCFALFVAMAVAWYGARADRASQRNAASVFGQLAVVALLLLASALVYGLPGARTGGTMPPPRSHITVAFFWLVAAAYAGYLISALPSAIAPKPWFSALLCLASIHVGHEGLRQVPRLYGAVHAAQTYANAYDSEFFRKLRKGGRSRQRTTPLSCSALPNSGPLHSAQLTPDSNHWINACVAEYFGVSAVVQR